jgi:hypothetical protein
VGGSCSSNAGDKDGVENIGGKQTTEKTKT